MDALYEVGPVSVYVYANDRNPSRTMVNVGALPGAKGPVVVFEVYTETGEILSVKVQTGEH
jgi:hypothetical protein